jgi:Rieske 2Fe-2S family protein
MSTIESSSWESRLAGLLARRRPGWSLEQPFYTDPDIFAWEIQKIYRHHWSVAGDIVESRFG